MAGETVSVVVEAGVIAVVDETGLAAAATVEEFGPPGASAYDTWLALPGNAGKSPAEFIESLRGESGLAPISADPGNRLTTGEDGGLMVPELLVDPLAHYILAKS